MTISPFPSRKTLVQPLIEIQPPLIPGKGRYRVVVWKNPFRDDGMSGDVETLEDAHRLAVSLQAILLKGGRK